MIRPARFEELLGETIVKIVQGTDELTFMLDNGAVYTMDHDQQCCERVELEDVCGDINDLLGSPVLRAEERTNQDLDPPADWSNDSWTWTFYEIATIKGSVTLRWFGTSNGYYSERVDFYLTKRPYGN